MLLAASDYVWKNISLVVPVVANKGTDWVC